jgi:hypothetical protein
MLTCVTLFDHVVAEAIGSTDTDDAVPPTTKPTMAKAMASATAVETFTIGGFLSSGYSRALPRSAVDIWLAWPATRDEGWTITGLKVNEMAKS